MKIKQIFWMVGIGMVMTLPSLWAQTEAEQAALNGLYEGDHAPALRLVKSGHSGRITLSGNFDARVSLLTIAISMKNEAAVRELLAAGIDLDLGGDDLNVDYDLAEAVRSGVPGVVTLLLARGANPNQEFSIRANGDAGKWRKTPLTIAAAEGHLDIVRLLLEAGAHPNLPALTTDLGEAGMSFRFSTPLDLAEDQGVTTLLRERGGVGMTEQTVFGVPARVKDSGLRLRREPSIQAGIVSTLAAGTRLTAVRTSPETSTINNQTLYWYQVVLPGGASGWVFSAFVELERDPWAATAR